jgi:hypothetical protein
LQGVPRYLLGQKKGYENEKGVIRYGSFSSIFMSAESKPDNTEAQLKPERFIVKGKDGQEDVVVLRQGNEWTKEKPDAHELQKKTRREFFRGLFPA